MWKNRKLSRNNVEIITHEKGSILPASVVEIVEPWFSTNPYAEWIIVRKCKNTEEIIPTPRFFQAPELRRTWNVKPNVKTQKKIKTQEMLKHLNNTGPKYEVFSEFISAYFGLRFEYPFFNDAENAQKPLRGFLESNNHQNAWPSEFLIYQDNLKF